jgi:hypothetical protein
MSPVGETIRLINSLELLQASVKGEQLVWFPETVICRVIFGLFVSKE